MEHIYEHHFFINESAGHGKSVELLKEIYMIYKMQDIIPYVHITKTKEEATRAVKRLALTPNMKYVYSFGGDGTLNSIVNGMVGMDNLILRVIPGGTGNDFYKMLGVDFPQQQIDLIKVNDSYTVGITSFGFDAEVTRYVEEIIKRRYGKSSFTVGIIREILKNPNLINNGIDYVNTDGSIIHIDDDLTLMAVCNGAYYGAGIHIAPSAKIDDGQLELIYAHSMSRRRLLKVLLEVLKGAHEDDKKNVFSERITKLEIHSKATITCNSDGLASYGTDFSIIVEPQILPVDNNFIAPIKTLLRGYKR